MGKKITICFDGTCNHPKDAKQERDWLGRNEIEDNGITNVLKLHLLLGGNLFNKPNPKIENQRSFYYSGVGTYGSGFQRIFNAAFAPPNMDVSMIINRAMKDLGQVYEEGDEIFLFGFSRGAALARRFAAVLPGQPFTPKTKEPITRFVGVFDTVAAIGAPNLDDEDKPVSDVLFEDCNVTPSLAEALHLVSLDENRTAFLPTLMNSDKRVTEVWFPGAHADVGGGFWIDGLSDVALQFMLDELSRRKLGLATISDDDIAYGTLIAPDGSYRIDHEDVHIDPDPLSQWHPKDRWWPLAKATLSCRECRVNVCDDPSSQPPLLHHSFLERFEKIKDYKPKALKGQPFELLQPNGNRRKYGGGLIDLIKPAPPKKPA